MDALAEWTVEQSRQLYSISRWGADYFDIDEAGHVVVYPQADRNKPCIDLYDIADSIQQHGLELPVLVRFIDVLEHRVNSLIDCFAKARADCNYQGAYVPVYPIKVNQQHTVIDGV
jgi:arginine decarboxylase